MKLQVEDLGNGLKEIKIDGRLDVQGSLALDAEFPGIIDQCKNAFVDMRDVAFLASLGIRSLVTAAKTLSNKSGHFILIAPQPAVEKVLTSTGISTVIPVVESREAALKVINA